MEQLLTQRLTQIDDLHQQREELLGQRDEVRQQLQVNQQQAEQTRLEQQRYLKPTPARSVGTEPPGRR